MVVAKTQVSSSNNGNVNHVQILNQGERGWWFGIPGALMAITGLGELCGSVYHFVRALAITAFTGKAVSEQHGSAVKHVQRAGDFALSGLAHIVEGVVGVVPFVGPEVARYIAKQKVWDLSVAEKETVSFMGISAFRNKENRIEVTPHPKDVSTLQWLNEQAGKCWVIPGAIVVLIGLGEVLAAVGKFVWPLGVMACSGFSKVASGKHGEALLHWKIAFYLLKRGFNLMDLGAELMIPHLGKLKSQQIIEEGDAYWETLKLPKDPKVAKFLGLKVERSQNGGRIFSHTTPATDALVRVMNNKARGWGFGIPGAATVTLGIVEIVAGLFEMVVKPAQILVKSAIARQWKGEPIGHFMIGYTLLFRGLENAITGFFEVLPFIGPNVARAVACHKGWTDNVNASSKESEALYRELEDVKIN